MKTLTFKNWHIQHIQPTLIQICLPSDGSVVPSLRQERFSICSCYPTGPAERDRQAGSVAADCSEGGGPSGCAGSVRYTVELVPAPLAAQPQKMHQDTSAQGRSGTGRDTKVFIFLHNHHGLVCMSWSFSGCFSLLYSCFTEYV